MQTTVLRPLGAGELLDRAVTLFVRRFVPIALVAAAVLVPLLVLQALLTPAPVDLLALFSRLGTGARPSPATMRALETANVYGAWITLISMLARLLQWSALVAVVAAAYGGVRMSIGAAYRIAAQRWLNQLFVGIQFALIALLAAIPWFMLYIGLVFALTLTMTVVKALAVVIVVAVVGGLVVVALGAVLTGWLFIAYSLASVAVVMEGMHPVTAVTTGLNRAFGAPMRWRSLAAGLVALLLDFGAAIPIVALGALLAELTHVQAVYWATVGLGDLLTQCLMATFLVIYAVDVRVRREGIDLLPAAEQGALGIAAV